MESITNTAGNNARFYFIAIPPSYTKITLSELGRNVLGISYIFKAGTNFRK